MKKVFRYYFGVVSSSLAFYVWVFLLFFCFIVPIFFHFDGIVESYLMRPLLRSQVVLYAAWGFLIFQGGYWGCSLAADRRLSGFSVWWSALGISPLEQFSGLLLAVLAPCLAFIFIALGFLGLVSSYDRAIPLSLLFEQGALISCASVLYCSLCILLGAFFESSFALSLILIFYFFSIKAMFIVRSAVAAFSEPFRTIASWIIFLLPNFDLYFRPGAVIHFWPLLPFNIWVGIALYTLIWLLIFCMAAKRLFRPWLI